MSAVSLLLALTVVSWICVVQGDLKQGDRLCRFFSDGTKKCFKNCKDGSVKNLPGIPNNASPDKLPENQDILLGVKCTDSAVKSKWSPSQGYLFPKSGGPPLYVGACILHKDKPKKWNCRHCSARTAAQQYCFNDGQSHSFNGAAAKEGWTEKSGPDSLTLVIEG